MYIRGIGKTKFGLLHKGLAELAYEAMQKALEDADMSARQLDAVYVANFIGGPQNCQLHFNSVVAGLLPDMNIPIIRVETACASGAVALYQALISLCRFKNVLVVGAEKMNTENVKESSRIIGMAGERMLDQREGLMFPVSYALMAQQHMLKYGTTKNDLDLVSYKNHQNANINPYAHFYGKGITMEMIKNSAVISEPLRLFDCSPITDGAAAAVVSRDRKSRRDVEVIASSMATDAISLAQRKTLTSFIAAKKAAKEAFKEAKLTPKDLDLAQVHDCFTIAELVAMEDVGICKPGESKDYVRAGKTKLGGEIPINVDGGLKASGHPIGATGVSQICEVTTQLRGEAGKRQVKNAQIGLTHNIGGVGGTAVVHILRRNKK